MEAYNDLMKKCLEIVKEIEEKYPARDYAVKIIATKEVIAKLLSIIALQPSKPLEEPIGYLKGIPLIEDPTARKGQYGIVYADGHIEWFPEG